MSKSRSHSPEFKDRIAIEAISGRKTIQEIAADHAISLNVTHILKVKIVRADS